jgi:hypothetical protein
MVPLLLYNPFINLDYEKVKGGKNLVPAFRLARPKIRAAFKAAGPPPIIAQSNSISILFNCIL